MVLAKFMEGSMLPEKYKSMTAEQMEARIREIKDDYYTFDPEQFALVGEVTKNTLQLGDEVIVKVKNADLVKKQLDFTLIKKAE